MDERQTQRVVTDLEVEARIRGRSVRVLVYDLSQGGCMIELPEPLVKPSDNLRLKFLDFECGGYIAWEHGGFAGMKFYHELDQAMVARLGFRLRGTPFLRSAAPRPLRKALAGAFGYGVPIGTLTVGGSASVTG